MAFVIFDDDSGTIEGLIFPKYFKKYEKLIKFNMEILTVEGKVSLVNEPRIFFSMKISIRNK